MCEGGIFGVKIMTKEERANLINRLNRIYNAMPDASQVAFKHQTCKWYVINGEIVNSDIKTANEMLRNLIDEVSRHELG